MSVAKFWLLKAEPDSRIVKGKEVKFSVDDFERVATSPWEGVRNYEARNLMKEMNVGEKALFYHSNCKAPGIAAFAEVSKEAYPDYTAWDSSHPYYDAKSDADNPKWYMVDLTFGSRAKNFVPLALLKFIADLPSNSAPEEIDYLGEGGVKAIKGMDLVTRGRLSVQRVGEGAWNAIGLLAEKGGWEEMDLRPKKTGKRVSSSAGKAKGSSRTPKSKSSPTERKGKTQTKYVERDKNEDDEEAKETEDEEDDEPGGKYTASKRKRKATDEGDEDFIETPRRSTRRR